MSFLSLSNELLRQITRYLGPKDLFHLTQSNHFLAGFLAPLLHEYALRDEDGMPALFWAVMGGHEPLVTFILDSGADVNMAVYLELRPHLPNPKLPESPQRPGFYLDWLAGKHAALQHPCQTPLQWAVSCNKPELVKLLLEKGADVNQSKHKCEFGTPWCQKVIYGQYRIGTALHYAVDNSNPHHPPSEEIVRMLLEGGADANAFDSYGDSPLHIHLECSSDTSEAIIKRLLDSGADINAYGWRTYRPLQLALFNMRRYQEGVLKLFIERGANTIHGFEGTPLHYVVKLNFTRSEIYSIDVVRFFILNLPDINSKAGKYGRTALHYAVLPKGPYCLELVKLLVENGANPEIRDRYGHTALGLARRKR